MLCISCSRPLPGGRAAQGQASARPAQGAWTMAGRNNGAPVQLEGGQYGQDEEDTEDVELRMAMEASLADQHAPRQYGGDAGGTQLSSTGADGAAGVTGAGLVNRTGGFQGPTKGCNWWGGCTCRADSAALVQASTTASSTSSSSASGTARTCVLSWSATCWTGR